MNCVPYSLTFAHTAMVNSTEMTKFYITANTLDLVRDLEDFYNIKSLKSVTETILKSKSKSLYVK